MDASNNHLREETCDSGDEPISLIIEPLRRFFLLTLNRAEFPHHTRKNLSFTREITECWSYYLRHQYGRLKQRGF